MDRRAFIASLAAVASAAGVGVLAASPGGDERRPGGRRDEGTDPMATEPKTTDGQDFQPLEKSEEEWKRLLDDDEFRILRKERTERAFSSPLNSEERRGTFICAGCFLPLFSSETKFESGTGWPSFWAPIEGRVDTKRDFKLLLPRTEYHCARCGGHQGHVFDDGPEPTGKRYCNNGVALDFVPEGETLPELRR